MQIVCRSLKGVGNGSIRCSRNDDMMAIGRPAGLRRALAQQARQEGRHDQRDQRDHHEGQENDQDDPSAKAFPGAGPWGFLQGAAPVCSVCSIGPCSCRGKEKGADFRRKGS